MRRIFIILLLVIGCTQENPCDNGCYDILSSIKIGETTVITVVNGQTVSTDYWRYQYEVVGNCGSEPITLTSTEPEGYPAMTGTICDVTLFD